MKELLKKLWAWAKKHQSPILQVANAAVLVSIYVVNKKSDPIETIAGLWIFSLVAYYGYKLFSKYPWGLF
jgi:hypothetical protein